MKESRAVRWRVLPRSARTIRSAAATSTTGRSGPIGSASHAVNRTPDVVDRAMRAGQAGAVRATVERVLDLDSVANHLAAAMCADGRKLVDRTLEAVEDVALAGGDDLERHVVVVAANLAR